MLSYNGFDPKARAACEPWLRRETRAGRVKLRPCDACGAEKAGPHAEDYSKPFGPHIYAYMLCASCHQAVHRRHRPDSQDRWARLKAKCSARIGGGRTVLDDIEEQRPFPSRPAVDV